MNKEFLKMQKLAGVITEGQYKVSLDEIENIYELDDTEKNVVDDVKDEMSAVLKALDAELNKASKSTDQPTNEGLLTIAGFAIALPAIMGLIAKFGKAAGALVNKMLGKKPNEGDAYNQWLTKLSHIADELHHLYLIPIEGIVKKFVKDPKKAHNISNGIFHIIVAVFLVASGVTAVKAFQAKNISLTTLESALTAVKSGEIQAFLEKLFA